MPDLLALALPILKVLNNLYSKWKDAPKWIKTLQITIESLMTVANALSKWIETNKKDLLSDAELFRLFDVNIRHLNTQLEALTILLGPPWEKDPIIQWSVLMLNEGKIEDLRGQLHEQIPVLHLILGTLQATRERHPYQQDMADTPPDISNKMSPSFLVLHKALMGRIPRENRYGSGEKSDARDNSKLRQDIDNRLKDSWIACVPQFERVQVLSTIPLVPFIGLFGMKDAYWIILQELVAVWEIKTSPQDLFQDKKNQYECGLMTAVLDRSPDEIVLKGLFIALGPHKGDFTARVVLKTVIGLSLIFQRLFLTQNKGSRVGGRNITKVTKAMVREEAKSYRTTDTTQRISGLIGREMTLLNCYNLEKVEALVKQAFIIGRTT